MGTVFIVLFYSSGYFQIKRRSIWITNFHLCDLTGYRGWWTGRDGRVHSIRTLIGHHRSETLFVHLNSMSRSLGSDVPDTTPWRDGQTNKCTSLGIGQITDLGRKWNLHELLIESLQCSLVNFSFTSGDLVHSHYRPVVRWGGSDLIENRSKTRNGRFEFPSDRSKHKLLYWDML